VNVTLAVNINQSISSKGLISWDVLAWATFAIRYSCKQLSSWMLLQSIWLESCVHDSLLHCLVFKEHPRLLFCRNTVLLPPRLPSTYALCTFRSGSSLRLVLQQNPFANYSFLGILINIPTLSQKLLLRESAYLVYLLYSFLSSTFQKYFLKSFEGRI
jgi:hypothetical protein